MLRINKLHIKNFRNIDDLDINFSNQNGLSVLIGNNGSGKSNILEAIVAIFANLYWKTSKYSLAFEYDIEYTYDDHTITINKSGEEIFIDNTKKNIKDLANFLPKNIIACYSGETERLQEQFFTPHRKRFVRKRIHGKNAVLNLLFINKEMWDMSLLCLFLHPFNEFIDIQDFCQNTLNIKDIKDIKFEINPNLLTQENEAKQLIDAISPDKATTKSLSLIQIKEIIGQLGFAPREVFMALYIGLYSHAIKKTSIIVEQNSGKIFNANQLSEGEKKLLSVFTMLEVLGDESSLMLYDEPDSQIHISRKGEIKKLVEKYNNRQHIITTHSPTLASAFFDSQEHLLCLTKNAEGCVGCIDKDKSALIADLTDNIWNISEQYTFLASPKPITLLLEGKTDKIHIEAAFKHLKNDYKNIDFDCFYFGGADNIPQFVIGLKTCEIDFSNRKIIAIFDNDKEGRDCCNQTQVKYNNTKNKYGLYAITLPTKSDATIENLYDNSKYNMAFQQVVTKNTFKGLVSQYSNDITKEAKIELSNMAKSFPPTDFEGFKPLFDLIEEIRQK